MAMDKRDLHVERLRKRLEEIPALNSKTIHDTEFQNWHTQTRRSLIEIFGNTSSYNRDFMGLTFRESRIRGPREPRWTLEDYRIFVKDLARAEQVIRDALEEAEIPVEKIEAIIEEKPSAIPQLVINITNTLSQVTNVEIAQVLQNLNNLGLTPSQEHEAEQLAKELDSEVKGQKRWPILAKCIDGLKTIGDSVYKQVAIPLLLEMLKKEMGL